MSKRHKCLLTILISALFLLTTFRIHRYSIEDWNRYVAIEDPKPLAGQVRGIRSDDSFVSLPTSLSQLATEPPFACDNSLIGRSASMQIWYRSLCFDNFGWVAAVLKPHLWAYVLGPDYGIAWQWWMVELGLFYSCFLFVFLQTGRRFYPSVFISLGFVFAPFQQFWSLNQGEIFIFGFLMAIIIHTAFQKPSRLIALQILGFAFALASFTLVLYPPTQVQIGYFLLAFTAATLLQATERLRGLVILFLGTACGIALAAGIIYVARDAFEAMLNSSYPGRRVSFKGEMYWADWIRSGFLPSRSVLDWGQLGNICEAAGFVLMVPWLLPRIFNDKNNFRQFPVIISLLAFALAGYWMTFGVSETVARLTLLSFVPSTKGFVLFGIFDLWLLSICINEFSDRNGNQKIKLLSYLPALFIILAAGMACWRLHTMAGIPLPRFLVYGALGLLSFYLSFKKPIVLAPLFFLWTVSLTYHFNPIARGGARELIDAPLSQDLKRIQERYPESRWACIIRTYPTADSSESDH